MRFRVARISLDRLVEARDSRRQLAACSERDAFVVMSPRKPWHGHDRHIEIGNRAIETSQIEERVTAIVVGCPVTGIQRHGSIEAL